MNEYKKAKTTYKQTTSKQTNKLQSNGIVTHARKVDEKRQTSQWVNEWINDQMNRWQCEDTTQQQIEEQTKQN